MNFCHSCQIAYSSKQDKCPKCGLPSKKPLEKLMSQLSSDREFYELVLRDANSAIKTITDDFDAFLPEERRNSILSPIPGRGVENICLFNRTCRGGETCNSTCAAGTCWNVTCEGGSCSATCEHVTCISTTCNADSCLRATCLGSNSCMSTCIKGRESTCDYTCVHGNSCTATCSGQSCNGTCMGWKTCSWTCIGINTCENTCEQSCSQTCYRFQTGDCQRTDDPPEPQPSPQPSPSPDPQPSPQPAPSPAPCYDTSMPGPCAGTQDPQCDGTQDPQCAGTQENIDNCNYMTSITLRRESMDKGPAPESNPLGMYFRPRTRVKKKNIIE